jgi:hypothetical protein
VFVVEASQVTEMLEANVIAPYKFRKVSLISSNSVAISFFIVHLRHATEAVYGVVLTELWQH